MSCAAAALLPPCPPAPPAAASLEALYGDRALWIRAHQGGVPMGVAANMWCSMH